MSADEQPCRRCQTAIPVDARRCPQCGYEPASEGSAGRTVLLVLGALLTLSVVGAVLGIPLMAYAFYARRKAQARRPAVAPQ